MGWFDWIKPDKRDSEFDLESPEIKEELERYKLEKEEFEKKKNSMKYLYRAFHILNFEEGKQKSKEINIEFDTYSSQKLSNEEKKYQLQSLYQKLILIKKQALSTKIGSIVLKGETSILPPVNLDKKNSSKKKSTIKLITIIKRIG